MNYTEINSEEVFSKHTDRQNSCGLVVPKWVTFSENAVFIFSVQIIRNVVIFMSLGQLHQVFSSQNLSEPVWYLSFNSHNSRSVWNKFILGVVGLYSIYCMWGWLDLLCCMYSTSIVLHEIFRAKIPIHLSFKLSANYLQDLWFAHLDLITLT